MTEWFGESWGAPVCEPENHGPTPIGKACIECDKVINAGDQGFTMPWQGTAGVRIIYYHRVCFLRTVLPCEMWSEEMKENMPERWRRHLEEHHG